MKLNTWFRWAAVRCWSKIRKSSINPSKGPLEEIFRPPRLRVVSPVRFPEALTGVTTSSLFR